MQANAATKEPGMRNSLWYEIKRAAYEAPRMYFAPITGAFKGIRREYRELHKAFAARPHERRPEAEIDK